MPRRQRATNTSTLSFLDVMSCGFGAIVLVFLVLDHSIEQKELATETSVTSELSLLTDEAREGLIGLTQVRNSIESSDLYIVEARGREQQILEQLATEKLKRTGLEQQVSLDQERLSLIMAEVESERKKTALLKEEAEKLEGYAVRARAGDGYKQYLTGLNLGGRNILIMFDVSSSMLASEVVNVYRWRVQKPELQVQAKKWRQAVGTLDWITARLPVGARYQVILFNTEAYFALKPESPDWLETVDTKTMEGVLNAVANMRPNGGTSFHNAFARINDLPSPPDNIILVTDGLPTQGKSKPKDTSVSGPQRLRLYNEAIKLLPDNVPVNTILLPMVGDPMAAPEFWKLAQRSQGSFLAPAEDWP